MPLLFRVLPLQTERFCDGVFSSTQFFGAFLGGLLGGYVAQALSAQAVFAAAALVGVIWLIIAWNMQVPPRSKQLA